MRSLGELGQPAGWSHCGSQSLQALGTFRYHLTVVNIHSGFGISEDDTSGPSRVSETVAMISELSHLACGRFRPPDPETHEVCRIVCRSLPRLALASTLHCPRVRGKNSLTCMVAAARIGPAPECVLQAAEAGMLRR